MSLEPRIRPHNHDAEQAVLGAMLIDESVPPNVFPLLKAEDFFTNAHALIYSAMRVISAQKDIAIDYITLCDELERTNKLESAGGLAYIAQLTHIMPSSANHMHYVEIVRRDAIRRRLIDASSDIIELAYKGTDDNLLGTAEKKIFEISAGEDRRQLTDLSASLARVVEKFDKIAREGNPMNGVPTGFLELDKLLHGLQPSDLIVLGARPGVGKTSFAMNVVYNAAQSVRPGRHGTNEMCVCAVFSMEMSDDQLAQRLLCSTSGVSMNTALQGIRNTKDWEKIYNAQTLLARSQIYVDDTSQISISQMMSKCRRLKAKHGLDLIVIDYLQLMDTSNDEDGIVYSANRNLEIGKITRRLKMMAKELNIPVLLLSQLKRPANQNKNEDVKPELIDLRDSGSIEQDADIVMFLHKKYSSADKTVRPSLRNRAELIVAKHRNGQCDTIDLYWNGETVSYISIDTTEARQAMRKDDTEYTPQDAKPQSTATDADDGYVAPDEAPEQSDAVIGIEGETDTPLF